MWVDKKWLAGIGGRAHYCAVRSPGQAAKCPCVSFLKRREKMFGDGPTSRSVSPSFESLEPRLLLDGGLENQAGPYLFEFSVDIGSDAELSDPNLNGNEAFDPGDVYLWRSGPVIPPGRDGFKDDAGIFDGRDPFPDPPDPNVPPATRVPVGQGGPENYGDFFDLDGHDQIDIYLPEFVPPDGPLGQPIPQGPSQCIFPAGYLMISMDDDMAWGWPAGDVPVTAPSPAGLTYGTTAGQDEIIGLIVAGSGPNSYIVVVQYGVADEAMVHLSLAPNPDKDPREDDDLDSLDILYDQGVCPFWYFSVDHEANLGGDPGDIYLATPGGPVKVIDEAIHLGIPEEVDIDAFEFVWLQEQPGGASYLALLFSVDEDDPLTKEDESGGGQPGMIYGSFLTGFSFPLLRQSLGDDVDAIANWHESLGPELDWGDAPEPAVAAGYPTTAGNNGANHVIGGPWLGDTTDNPDAEPDGQPDPNALGDDNDGNDDEDGVQMPVLIQGQPTTVPLEVNGAPAGGAWVDGWIDWNGDMTWDDASERVLLGGPVPDGVYSFGVMAPLGSVVGQTFARFRISSVGGLSPTGPAPDGEVEDYEVWIEEAQRDWGDAPDWAGAPM
jgi:hypothetical protein